MTFEIGIHLGNAHPTATATSVVDLAVAAEQNGFASVFMTEHIVVAGDVADRYGNVIHPIPTLGFLAARTNTLRLGTSVIVAPLHPPVVLAKRAATLACLSGDRFQLGLGIGWQKEEYTSVGVPYADRGRRLDESIGAMRELWANHPATYHGRYVDFDRIHLVPPPPSGRIPIVLGGNSRPAIERCARIGDGWYPHAISPADFAIAAEWLRGALAAAGRSAADVPISLTPSSADRTKEYDRDWVQHYVDHGATRVVIRSGITGPDNVGPALREAVERYREQVLDRLR